MQNKNTTYEPYVSIAEIANTYRISPRTIHRYVADGIIPCHRISKRMVRYRISEVEEALIGRRS